ncbi:hypothetical protein [Actinomadura latina]|uniref:Lipoprotein n=1 Tax=Actinomadura latina TaxID=163603 RepID=A0A846YY65_9ACTN|nr:hypothetical protein [Actinomadura latina]NKZ03555.1 hypothetical protein [Actinomadura latina]
MRYTRVIPPVALLTALSACTNGEPSFNPTPAPTRPGQVVVIAGSPDDFQTPRDGEYAIAAGAHSDGGLAVDPTTGLTYYRALGREPLIARIERDGRVSTFRIDNSGDQIGIASGEIWIMSSGKTGRLSRVSLSSFREEDVLRAGQGRTIKIIGPSGRSLDPGQLDKSWEGARFALREDGVPVIATRAGDLFEVVGDNKVRKWEPEGYEAAVHQLAGTNDLRPQDVAEDGRHGLIVLGLRGLIRVKVDGPARAVRFPATTKELPPWSAVTPLADGSALLLGGTSAFQREPRPVLVRPDGRLERLAFGGAQWCDQFNGTLAAVASAEPGGLARTRDGNYVLSDKNCGRIYRFRLPKEMSGVPYR